MNRTDRLYALVEELRASAPSSRTAKEMAARFEVSTRTVERDILALQEAGVPIRGAAGRRGGYFIDPQGTLPDLLPYNLPPPYFTNLDGSVQAPESPVTNYGQVHIQGALSANNLTAGGNELESERQLRLPKRRNTLENYKMFPFSRQKSNRSEGDVPLTDLGSKVVSLTSYSSPLHLKPISFFPGGQSSKNKRAKNKSCIVS